MSVAKKVSKAKAELQPMLGAESSRCLRDPMRSPIRLTGQEILHIAGNT